MGTRLMAAGGRPGESFERWVIDPARADLVREVHRAYRVAGAQVLLTNTFGANPWRLGRSSPGEVEALNRVAAELARREAGGAVVAGSIGPSGELLAPLGLLAADEAADGYAIQAGGLVAGGVDALWIETMSDLEEVRAAVEGSRRAAPHVPIVVTLTFKGGRTMMGTPAATAASVLVDLGVLAGGANCGEGFGEVEVAIAAMHAAEPDLPLVAKPNAGLPLATADGVVYPGTPADAAAHALRVVALGASLVGGCCGTTPDHVAAIADALAGH
jgi:5-methyltetrahydrofolate--homocysteine methyltransferase